ncbi:MAG: hypothetical protein GF317_20395 [Candidatus Lokiarchaeota archaeon]|nr:hypothetical protein [Candidatus Lokiarchaeota archaeon]MBD3201847.1 hypothetical protein [Candidatus Lokiarchaeota archaeon]
MKNKKLGFSIILGSFLVFSILWGMLFGARIQEILYSPLITPEQWCQTQPCIEIFLFGKLLKLVKPTSSIIVYSLGFITLILGMILLYSQKKHQSRLWWGIALILWGLGALFAGTSYQLFSYQLKCAGNIYCVWTTWYEIIYLLLSVGSIDAMFSAQIYSCLESKKQKLYFIYTLGHFLFYFVIILIGAYIPVRFLISFEFFIIYLIPNILFFLILNGKRYLQYHNLMDRNLIIIWISLIIIIAAYFIYYLSGLTDFLWNFGIWFSENDVLHIGLIIWMIYIQFVVRKQIVDYMKN